MWLLLAFIAVPLLEITLFIQVGNLLGTWPTLLIVLGTAIVGAALVRRQGMMTLAKLQSSFTSLEDPTEPLANGAMILFSGALLLTPGFFTDAIGFALLIPAVRRALFIWARSRMKVNSFTMGRTGNDPHQNQPEDVIDADFEDLTKHKRPTHGPSGWTRH